MTSTGSNESESDRLKALLVELTLEEKVQLLTGQSSWSTHPMEKIGLRPIVFSDGPSGVRGEVWDERSPSLSLPSTTALSSSWDASVAERFGAVLAAEARRKSVDVVLGPTVNLHRSPLGGRHFEAFSEDPLLTAGLAAAYVHGLQSNGVGATPKHYVANDFETDRYTVDVQVSERALRELYLLAFEKTITESHAWLVMSAYNSINGAPATESDLLETPLNSEWGFDGVVISDWSAVRSIESARRSQDLAMPGPDGPWGDALVEAVRQGDVDETAVDRKVLRILTLAARVGALRDFDAAAELSSPREDTVAFVRKTAGEGTVLLRNNGVLPITADVKRIAVIGHNADRPRFQGGGSAMVIPERVVSPLEGIQRAFPDAHVEYRLGAVVHAGVASLNPREMRNPVTGGAGARVRFLADDGTELHAEDRFASSLTYLGGDAHIGDAATIEFSTIYTPTRSEPARLGFASIGTARIRVDDVVWGEIATTPSGGDLVEDLLSPPTASLPIDLIAGRSIIIVVEFSPLKPSVFPPNTLSLAVGFEPTLAESEELIADAADAARGADLAIVVVGTNSRIESEGSDRDTLALPGRQDDLVDAVIAANPNTIVLVNSGAPVLMPWHERTAALAITYFGGQEYGNAVADVLAGVREPGGRLPTTWPRAQADVPILNVTPDNGIVRYDEGIHIGYRAWLKAAKTPAYPFGFGLGYTTWSLSGVETEAFAADGTALVHVTIRNTGERGGKQVVQLYASRDDSAIDRPVRWLAGWGIVRAAAGETTTVSIRLDARSLAHWDDGWKIEAGEFTLDVGFSVDHLEIRSSIVGPQTLHRAGLSRSAE